MCTWTETLVLASLALVLGLLLLLRDQTPGAAGRPLWPQHVQACRVVPGSSPSYALLLPADGALLADLSYEPIARLRAADDELIRGTLADTRILRIVDMDPDDPAQRQAYGLDDAVLVQTPEQGQIHLATAVDGRGYAWAGAPARLWQLDRPAADTLRRDPTALRAADLGLPATCTDIHTASGDLQHRDGRWWWLQEDERYWLAQEAVAELLADLRRRRAMAFPGSLSAGIGRSWTIRGTDAHGRERRCQLTQYTDGIVLREERRESGLLREALALEDPLPELDPTILAPRRLCPLDPLQAERIHLGGTLLERGPDGWLVDGHADVDAELVSAVLQRLQGLPPPPGPRRVHRTAGPDSVQVVHGELR
ncbi:MAG: hypothetical protein ACOCXJ_06100, partial [Planctomycetota bacterium]